MCYFVLTMSRVQIVLLSYLLVLNKLCSSFEVAKRMRSTMSILKMSDNADGDSEEGQSSAEKAFHEQLRRLQESTKINQIVKPRGDQEGDEVGANGLSERQQVLLGSMHILLNPPLTVSPTFSTC